MGGYILGTGVLLTRLQPNHVGACQSPGRFPVVWRQVPIPDYVDVPWNPCPQQYPEASWRWLQTYADYRAHTQPHSSLLTGTPWMLWA